VFTGKEKYGKTTGQIKVTTAVNIKVTLLWIVTPFTLVQVFQSFGGNFSHRLQDILKKVAVVSP